MSGQASTIPPVSPVVPDQAAPRRFVQVIDLWTKHPAEVERLLNRWRTRSLADEQLVDARVGRDETQDDHLVLQVEYASAGPGEQPALPPQASTEAEAVVGLLDRAPRFRSAASCFEG